MNSTTSMIPGPPSAIPRPSDVHTPQSTGPNYRRPRINTSGIRRATNTTTAPPNLANLSNMFPNLFSDQQNTTTPSNVTRDAIHQASSSRTHIPGGRLSRLEDQIANLTRLVEQQNFAGNTNADRIESQHHLLSELPENDFKEVDLTSGIFSLREEKSSRSTKTSHKKNKKKSKWKFW
jgi:hypothetical protein